MTRTAAALDRVVALIVGVVLVVVGVAGVATIRFAGVGDCGAVFVVLVGGHSIAFLNKSDRRQRLSGGVDAVPPVRQLLGCAVGRGGFGLGGGLDERQ